MLSLKKSLSLIIFSLSFAFNVQAKITVFAASSMTNAMETAKTAFLKAHPDEEILLSFASSSKLARQIENGAPANIFISADQKWMDYLDEKNMIIKNSRQNLAKNALVMIAPKNSETKHVDLAKTHWLSLLNNAYLAVGEVSSVPAGRYAKEALLNLNHWEQVQNKLAQGQNVRVALAYVEQGESPLGIVYSTDAKMSDKVNVVATFPKESHKEISYPVAVINGQDNHQSRQFLEFLQSQAGKQIFADYGFIVE